MFGGTIGLLQEPIDEPLESWSRGDGGLPALDVETTQTSFDGHPVQSGTAATTDKASQTRVSVIESPTDGTHTLDVENERTTADIATDWVADVTGTGILAAESVNGDSDIAFPFDLFWARTGVKVDRPYINIEELHTDWSRRDVLGEVWMEGSETADGTSINYHDEADEDGRPTIGLGFKRPWGGTVARGVAYHSGYVAVYNAGTATEFIQFLEEEMMPYFEIPEGIGEDPDQTTLGPPHCDECGDPSENLEEHGDVDLCPPCLDAIREETLAAVDEPADEWSEGECEVCEHDRKRTKLIDGTRTCLLCDEGISMDGDSDA